MNRKVTEVLEFMEKHERKINIGCIVALGLGMNYAVYHAAKNKQILEGFAHVVFVEMGLKDQVMDHLNKNMISRGISR